MARLLLYLPLVFVAVDEPSNALTTRLGLALTGRSLRDDQPASGRPVVGISDVTELPRPDKPRRIEPERVAPPVAVAPVPSMVPDWIAPSGELAPVIEHIPEHVPLRC
jgi:hypothetical protein